MAAGAQAGRGPGLRGVPHVRTDRPDGGHGAQASAGSRLADAVRAAHGTPALADACRAHLVELGAPREPALLGAFLDSGDREIQLAAQSAKLRLPSPEVCEASFAMGEEFLTDQADLGQLEFDALLRKVDASDASYKN